MINWLKKHKLILLILALSAFARFYRIEATMTFLEDEGRDLLIVHRMLETKRPVLLGPQTSTGNMYLGPLYYYLITPALAISGMNPVGPAIFIAISGVFATYLLFVLGKTWLSVKVGLLASFLFAVLPFAVSVTRSSWNPNLVPALTTLMLLVYARLRSENSKLIPWFLYGILVGAMVQLHYMALIFIFTLSLALVFVFRKNLSNLFKGILLAFVGFTLVISPFLVFEARNNWVNTKAITRFMEAKEERNIRYDLPLWLWWDKVSKTSYRLISKTLTGQEKSTTLGNYSVATFVAITLTSLRLAVLRKKWIYVELVSIFIGSLAILGIYQENIHLHYIEFAIPIFILVLSGGISLPHPRWWKNFMIISLAVIAFYGITATWMFINSGASHQIKKARDVANYIVNRASGSEYNVVSTQGMYTTPFQYFLAISDNPPSNSLASRVFDICAGSPCPNDDETTTLLFLTGPAHPSLQNYLGHPELNSFSQPRRIVSNEHVSVGIWVAEIVLE